MKVRFVLLVLVFFLWAAPAFSQGCAMCYSSAVAASKDGQRAISKGGISVRKEARSGELLSNLLSGFKPRESRPAVSERSKPQQSQRRSACCGGKSVEPTSRSPGKTARAILPKAV